MSRRDSAGKLLSRCITSLESVVRLSLHPLPLFPGALKPPGSDVRLLDVHKPFQGMRLRLPSTPIFVLDYLMFSKQYLTL
jgi:hypothetical protein